MRRRLRRRRKELGGAQGVLLAALDVTDESGSRRAWSRRSAETLGGIDGVVNSAGIAADIPALDTPVDLFRKILDVNVVGTFIVARAAARVMKDTGGGAIVNLASISGRARQQGAQRLRRVEGRGVRADAGDGQRSGALRHPRQRRGAGPGRHADGAGRAHGARTGRCGCGMCRCAATASPTRSPTSSSSCSTARKSSYVTGEIVAVDGGFRGAGVIADD